MDLVASCTSQKILPLSIDRQILMPTKHPIEDLIASVYQLIEVKDNENLDIAFKRLCAEYNVISQERTPYMINLQFQAMAAIVRSQLYADVNDDFVAEEMQMINAFRYVCKKMLF